MADALDNFMKFADLLIKLMIAVELYALVQRFQMGL